MFDNIKYRLQEYWFSFLNNPTIERIITWYQTLPTRDKKLIKVGGGILAGLILINILWGLSSSVYTKQENIDKAVEVMAKLDDLNAFMLANAGELQSRSTEAIGSKYVSLIDLIEKQQATAFIKPDSLIELKETPKKEVENGKYIENTANVKYEKITIRQLTRLLSAIERAERFAKIDSLKIIRKNDDIRYIDASFEVIARIPK